LNLIANINFEEALIKAREADEIIKKNPKSELPPLIGVPVSIKDLITVANVPTTLGLTSNHDLVKNYDSLMVSVLKQKEVIPFVISNVPQEVYSIETSNFLWGSSEKSME
jgi:Asp-tRNA(Asn)/Glu-tRNA(Gln) amidotransferase A subunit family amidase